MVLVVFDVEELVLVRCAVVRRVVGPVETVDGLLVLGALTRALVQNAPGAMGLLVELLDLEVGFPSRLPALQVDQSCKGGVCQYCSYDTSVKIETNIDRWSCDTTQPSGQIAVCQNFTVQQNNGNAEGV